TDRYFDVVNKSRRLSNNAEDIKRENEKLSKRELKPYKLIKPNYGQFWGANLPAATVLPP
ncbi:MAG: hypothetical protein U1C56_00950, partial [Candidatus Curtissbacteria bacterium]|nr:hypothetical protein [Candidatus Curtissbacteria bacterium]